MEIAITMKIEFPYISNKDPHYSHSKNFENNSSDLAMHTRLLFSL
jgi:hypothetical protein